MDPQTMMCAIRQETLGGPEVLELAEVPRPDPIPTEVLVRMRAAGVNPVDWKVRTRGGFLGQPPFTVGWDVAGIVEAVGYGVTRFTPGDRVFGMPRFPREAAAYAEYVTSPSRQLTRIHEGLRDVEAAGLPLAGLTAWQALVETAGIGPGQRALILAAAGGVGHLAVQIAKARGAYVIGTASSAKHAFLAELGADEAIDYTSEAVEERVRDVDVVLDLVGSETSGAALSTLRDGGLFIVVPSAAPGVPDLSITSVPSVVLVGYPVVLKRTLVPTKSMSAGLIQERFTWLSKGEAVKLVTGPGGIVSGPRVASEASPHLSGTLVGKLDAGGLSRHDRNAELVGSP